MKKVLMVVQLLRRGGVELVALNFARSLDREKYDVSFLLMSVGGEHDEALEKEVAAQGYRVIKTPPEASSYSAKYKYMVKLMSEEKYDIVHSHVMFFSGLVLLAAEKCGVEKRVSHSHATKWNRKENIVFKIYKRVMRKMINRHATDILSCSKDAGSYLYGKKEYEKRGRFVANGVDTQVFAFNADMRKEKRNELNISDDEILAGHIGTIYYIKNQTFLAEVFAEMLSQNQNMRLLLVGEELDRDKVEEKARSLGVLDKIIFAGQRSDINGILQAMDIMIFPSLFEALPVSLIEAQASSLPCLISDAVTADVKFNENVDFMPLSEPAKKWAAKAFELLDMNRESVSVEKLKNNYDINMVAAQLDEIYSS